jgi:hypothetical protein
MGRTIERKPNSTITYLKGYTNIFLAGSIEQGIAEDWQSKIVSKFNDEWVIFYNPRRDSWDSTWVQSIDNDEFKNQAVWELTALEMADLIVMYFDPSTKSPISLLELGIHSKDLGKLVVLCPDGFWRKGNVDVVCKFYDINQVETFDDLITYIDAYIQNSTK